MGFSTPKAPKVEKAMAPIRSNSQDVAQAEKAARRAVNPQAGLQGTLLGSLDEAQGRKKNLFGQA